MSFLSTLNVLLNLLKTNNVTYFLTKAKPKEIITNVHQNDALSKIKILFWQNYLSTVNNQLPL